MNVGVDFFRRLAAFWWPQPDPDVEREIEEARRLARLHGQELDRRLREAAAANPCAAAVLDIGRALRNGHDLENPPARRREDADP